MSVRKDCCVAFGIHPIPVNISKKDFEAKCEALVESFLRLPVAQKNFVKFDIIFQNSEIVEQLSALGMPKARPTVCLRCEYETEANWAECLRNPDFVKAMDAGRSWGFHDEACIFTVDAISKFSCDIPHDRKVAVGLYKVPQNMSAAKFRDKMEVLLENIFKATNYPNIGVDLYIQTQHAEDHLQAAGYPPSQPMLIVVAESQTWDEKIKILENQEVGALVAAAMKDFNLHVDSVLFSGDVVTKFKRSDA